MGSARLILYGYETSNNLKVLVALSYKGIDHEFRKIDPGSRDTGFSGLLTFWPSEFSQIRGQYRLTNYAEGVRGNELLFQFLFSIGAHGAHTF